MNSKSLYSVLLPEKIYSVHVYCCSTFRSLTIRTLKEREKKEVGERNIERMLDERRRIIKEEEVWGVSKRKVTSWCLREK
jgi:hypothetical protein